jgi:hypothetical protein
MSSATAGEQSEDPRTLSYGRDAPMNVAPAPVECPRCVGVDHLGGDERDRVRQPRTSFQALVRGVLLQIASYRY